MLKECANMYNFYQPNVLTLMGVCLDGGTAPYIIMPFMANGSLLAYLKKKRETLVVSLSDKDEDEVRWNAAWKKIKMVASLGHIIIEW